MTLKNQKRLAADILKVGKTRVWLDPEAVDEVTTAMTRGDIRKYIGLGFISKKPEKGNSRGRVRKRDAQKKKGRRRGHGSREGGKRARTPKKKVWMTKIRAQRALLKDLKSSEKINNEIYRKTYRLAKAGTFKNKAQLRAYLLEKSTRKENEESKK